MQFAYPIAGGIVSLLLSPMRILKVAQGNKLQKRKRNKENMLKIILKMLASHLPLTPTSHPFITCPIPAQSTECI